MECDCSKTSYYGVDCTKGKVGTIRLFSALKWIFSRFCKFFEKAIIAFFDIGTKLNAISAKFANYNIQ